MCIRDRNTPTQGPNYAINSTILNNITLGGGWFNNPYGEGTDTEVSGWDVNTLTAGYDVWPTRTASKYSEYEPKGACAVPTGCTPPITMYFPTTDYCTGATPTSSCVGFTGAMSATSMPMTLTDYHGFELLAGLSLIHIYIAGTVNTELHYSYQCDNNSGFWRVGNLSPSFSWNLTTIPCSLANLTWHHIVFRGHRIAGDTSCSGHPAEYYDSITIDGTVNATIPTECSTVLPGGWSEQTGFNFQQDMGSSAATLTQYVDEVNFTSINPAGAFTLANGVATNPSSYNDVQNM